MENRFRINALGFEVKRLKARSIARGMPMQNALGFGVKRLKARANARAYPDKCPGIWG